MVGNSAERHHRRFVFAQEAGWVQSYGFPACVKPPVVIGGNKPSGTDYRGVGVLYVADRHKPVKGC